MTAQNRCAQGLRCPWGVSRILVPLVVSTCYLRGAAILRGYMVLFSFPLRCFFAFLAGTLRRIMIRQGSTYRGHFRFTKPTSLKTEAGYDNGIAACRTVSSLLVFSEMQAEYRLTLFLFLFFSGYPSAVVLSAVLCSSRNAAVIDHGPSIYLLMTCGSVRYDSRAMNGLRVCSHCGKPS